MNETKTKNEFKIKIDDKKLKKPTRPQQSRSFTNGNWKFHTLIQTNIYSLKAISKKK